MKKKNSNHNTWALTLSLCLIIFAVVTAYAAEESERMTSPLSSVQFTTKLQGLDRQLASIQASVTEIAKAKTDAEKDKYGDALNDTLAAYAKGMLESFDIATNQAQMANKSQGKEGNMEELKQFEDLAARHERTLKQIDARAKKMKAPPGAPSMSESSSPASGWSVLDKIGDLFVTPAEGAIALSVYNACNQNPPNQTACAQAIVSSVAQGNAARNTFNDCWNRYENTRPKWWRAICRAGCVTALAVRLA